MGKPIETPVYRLELWWTSAELGGIRIPSSTDPAPLPIIKIYGERNTGTNYLAQLLVRNLDVRLLPGVVPKNVSRLSSRADRLGDALGVGQTRSGERIKDLWFASTFRSNLGWKHVLVPVDRLTKYELARRTTFVTLSKNPYSWAISMFKRPYHSRGNGHEDLGMFVNSPWQTVGREHAPKTYSSPADLWNAKNWAYRLLLGKLPVANIRYEDLLQAPSEVIERVRQRCEARPLATEYTNVMDSTKGESDKGYSFYQQYYLGERWRDELDADTVSTLNSMLDPELVTSLGYELLDPKDFS